MDITTRKATATWVLLIALTVLSVFVGRDISSSIWLITVATMIIAVKGFQIVEIFMGLKFAPPHWRSLFVTYVIVIPTIIGIIYSTALFGFRN
jgi:hypothetical protein